MSWLWNGLVGFTVIFFFIIHSSCSYYMAFYFYSPNTVWIFILIFFFIWLFITFKSYMKTSQKIVNNLINENIFPFKGQLIKKRWAIFEDNQFMWKHISQNKYFNIPVSVWFCYTCSYMRWVWYKSQYNKLSDIQDVRNGLWFSMLDFGQVVDICTIQKPL